MKALPLPLHHAGDGRFRNPWPDGTLQRFSGLLRWQLDRPTKSSPVQPDPSVFRSVAPMFPQPRASEDRVVITWVGHASFLLQIGGLNVLTDPVWSERASPLPFVGPRRGVPPGVPLDALPPIDAVLISHNHYDHLDDRTVRRLAARAPGARWLVPLGLAPFVATRGARAVLELDWWQEERLDGVRIGCTPAQHFSARGFGDQNRTLWCGWALGSGARRIYFAGDTGYHPGFGAIADRYGPFHAALLPIGAYEPRWFMRPVHMNPEEAVRAFADLVAARPANTGEGTGRPAVMVPMHWGTFKLTDEPMDEPPVRAARAWQAAGLRPTDLWVLAHGESRTL